MLAPAGTPKEIVAKLNKAAVAAISAPEVKEQLKQLGAQVIGDSPEEFRKFLVADKARWASVIKHGNVKPE
jgi:tripartite-type tricarboxylate transporter receptor subunit TctC